MIALLLAGWAHAKIVTNDYCVDYATDFYDDTEGDYLNGATVTARGVVLRFVNESTQASFDATTAWNGAAKGCATVPLADSVSWTIKVLRRAVVNGNTIEVHSAAGALGKTTVATGHVPNAQIIQYPYTVQHTWGVHMIAAASFAMYRRNVGVTGETFVMVTDDCPGESGGCWDPGSQQIYISEDLANYKFGIAHELGHALSAANSAYQGADFDYVAVLDDCSTYYEYTFGGPDGHQMTSKEYNSAAATEALAHFYSAIAFNDDGHSDDCEMSKHYLIDWNEDGFVTENNLGTAFTCSDASMWESDAGDLFGEFCQDGVLVNRGTEYDWLRMYWDLRTFHDYTGADIFDIYAAASPWSWTASGDSTGVNYPSERMHAAAYTVGGNGMQADYDTAADFNGTNR